MNKEELSKGFTGIEINGVRFSNIKEMLSYMNKQRVRIIDLENENAELKAGVEKRDSDILTLKGLTERQRLKLDALEGQTPWKDIKDKSELIGKLTKAKEIIRNIIRVTWGEGWNYSLEWKVKAEQFLKEVEK